MSFRVIFTGKVQNVGFRATCKKLADRENVKGYVRNLPDGSVEAFFDCDEKVLKNLIEKLKEIFEIRNIEIFEEEAKEKFKEFEIIL